MLLYHIGQAAIENAQQIDEHGSQIAGNCVFDCHLSPVGRQTAVEISVSSDPGSTFVDSINVFDCRYLKCLFNIGLLNT